MNKIEEIERLNLYKKEIYNLEFKIEQYSLYKTKDLGSILAKLMTAYEGIQYQCIELPNFFTDSEYRITEEEENEYSIWYNVKKDINKLKYKPLIISYQKEEYSFYPPNGYLKTGLKLFNERKELFYIQEYINYLFQKRLSLKLNDITIEQLEKILEEYLELTKEQQEIRKKNRIQQITKQKEYEIRKQFEDSCMIDRKPFFNAIDHIINHYEGENLSLTQKFEEEWSRSSGWSTLYLYHKLVLKKDNIPLNFRALVGSDGAFPDEEECAYVNKNKSGLVNFFDLKRTFQSIYKNTCFFNIFMNELERLYEKKRELTEEDIYPILVNLSNRKKEKTRLLSLK